MISRNNIGMNNVSCEYPRVNNNSCAKCKEYTIYYSTQIPNFNMNVWIVNEYSQLVQESRKTLLTYPKVTKSIHMD